VYSKITVEQGYNIRLLTLVTLFYLPLSYVTGIYGSTFDDSCGTLCPDTDMSTVTNMPPEDSFLPFALTTVGICVPTYLLILIVNNPEASRNLLANIGLLFTKVVAIPAPKKSGKLRDKILEHKMPHGEMQAEMQKSATFASLEGRLSQDLTHQPSLLGSPGLIHATRRVSQSLANHLHTSGTRHVSQIPTQSTGRLSAFPGEVAVMRQRSSTIQFEEPFSSQRTTATQIIPIPEFEKSSSNISAISPLESPPPAVILTKPDGKSLPARPQRGLLRAPDSRTERSPSPLSRSAGMSLFARLSNRLSSTVPSPKSSQPGTPKETV
jgi:hypothetical protein